ncbi:MAG TPA: DUF4384 domain-containing protein [Pirellulales bacterium]|nr:DUF4384 domain-containing protein [Pirellulales bacterium]
MRSRLRRLLHASLAIGVLATETQQAIPQTAEGARGIIVEEIRNERPSFMVRVYVDQKDNTYEAREEMRVAVRSEKPGFLYLLYRDARGQVACIFPNRVQTNNRIQANTTTFIPAEKGEFKLRIAAPYGKELLKAVVALEPLKELQLENLTKTDTTLIDDRSINRILAEVRKKPHAWAEHDVEVTTVVKRPTQPAARRFGIFIGISDFATVNDLSVAHKDAAAMEDVMKAKCKLDASYLLVNEKATLKAIEDLVRRRMPALTRPGDTIFLYWSGHGGRCPDDDGDEADGYDEFLVPYDGTAGPPATLRRTMLMDDTFGRWIQELDGRKLVLILDTCHSGGQSTDAKGTKGISAPDALVKSTPNDFDFFDGELLRAKDIGQKETAILAAARPSQFALERREGDLGAMTYFLVKQLREADGPITLALAIDYLTKRVPPYVNKNFPGISQTPILVDHSTPPLFLKP